ncbi:MAG: polysaccharide deacetylase family protein [Selenomonadales bacterium]|nr:polysaccharide deacetylase family protein [Selenomonadales bacterium]
MARKRSVFFGCAVMLAVLVGVAGNRLAEIDETVIRRAQTADKIVAVTIDDGPHREATPRMLEALREADIKATFFVLGQSAEEHPALIKRVIDEGHEIGMHGYSHRNMARLSRRECDAQWDRAEEALAAYGIKPTLFRPPGGAYGQAMTEGARSRGYRIILWDVDPRDWQVPSADEIVSRVMADVRPGSVILLHDGQYPIHSADAVKKLVKRLREDGYSFVTVSELLGISAGGAE